MYIYTAFVAHINISQVERAMLYIYFVISESMDLS